MSLENLTEEELQEIADNITEEDFDQLDELSKKTLGRYINKAANDMAHSHAKTITARQDYDSAASIDHSTAGTPSNVRDKAKSIIRQDASDRELKARSRVGKRYGGIETATKKLTREDFDQLDELSKKTLGRYINKASDDNITAAYNSGKLRAKSDLPTHMRDKEQENLRNKTINRSTGIRRATKKLTEDLNDLISCAIDRKPVDFAEMFDNILTSKIENRIEDVRYNVANSLYGDPLEEEFDLTEEELQEIADNITEEDFDQLDELSKKTLASYLPKAGARKSDLDRKHLSSLDDAKPEDYYQKKGSPFTKAELAKRLKSKSNAKDIGIKRAIKKLTREEFDQLDELSRKTLQSYGDKALRQSHRAVQPENSHDSAPYSVAKAWKDTHDKRKKGLKLAAKSGKWTKKDAEETLNALRN